CLPAAPASPTRSRVKWKTCSAPRWLRRRASSLISSTPPRRPASRRSDEEIAFRLVPRDQRVLQDDGGPSNRGWGHTIELLHRPSPALFASLITRFHLTVQVNSCHAPQGNARARSPQMTLAALRPGAMVTPEPGWLPAPQR